MDPAPRRGRRDNGLDAAAFVPLADVDPRIGEHLLDVLGAAGVPAYLEPSVDIEPYTRALALPSPPTDRLWVDREQRLTARQIIETEAEQAGQSGLGPPGRPREEPDGQSDITWSHGLPDADEEQIWRQIIASYESDTTAPVPPWPVSEDSDTRTADPDKDADPDRPRWRRTGDPDAAEPLLPGELPPGAAADEEEHYVPPPPPPVPRLSRQAILAIALLLIGLVLVFAPGQVGLEQEAGLLFGVVSILSGAGVLILRLRESRSDDDPDDGAVV
ncbi:MAG TPA: hypothetical protein VMU51_25460 [Mycobacteriales bacterium]|nr:hypothetical protein [Mycobacteriales bacterium]